MEAWHLLTLPELNKILMAQALEARRANRQGRARAALDAWHKVIVAAVNLYERTATMARRRRGAP